nr:hypothetical protein [uncultured Flavobacterium sp.]
MKVSSIIENVRNFNFFNNEMIVETKDNTIYNGDESFKFKGESYTTLENNCIGDIQEEYTDIYNLNFEHLVRIEKQGVIGVSIIDKDTYSVRWEDENDFSSIYKNRNEIKTREFFYGRYLNSKYRITFNGFNRTEIFFYNDILSDKYLWHYTLPEGFKIFGSVQAIDNVLFFSCTDAYVRNSKLIVLEIETGKILWEFENLIDFQIDHKNKLLRGYQGAYYQVIDPFEGKLLNPIARICNPCDKYH